MNNPSGYLAEVFASHQGEGPWLGFRQIFIRLAGCSQTCNYCDTEWARTHRPHFWRLRQPGASRMTRLANPVTPRELVSQLDAILKAAGPFHSLAITGGEPLEQIDFLEAFLVQAQPWRPKIKILLETNGLEMEAARFKGLIDYIAMDVKLKPGGGPVAPWPRIRQWVASAVWAPGCAKVVIQPDSAEEDIAAAAQLIRHQAPEWDVVLQPMSGAKWTLKKNQQALDRLSQTALAQNPRARVIPQTHRLLGMD